MPDALPSLGHGSTHSGRLLISCPDGPGIVAAVAGFLFERSANIVSSNQFSTHPEHGSFFMRVAFFLPELDSEREEFESAFSELARRFEMQWRITYASERKRAVIMASREDHCLTDLLWRNRRGELDMELVAVISNHDDLRADVETLGIPYHHVPATRETKPQAEEAVLELIGATAHYVSEELDAGPIIDQDVQRVAHDYTVEDLIRVGRDVERVVLARALRSHLDDRVLVHDGRTIVF